MFFCTAHNHSWTQFVSPSNRRVVDPRISIASFASPAVQTSLSFTPIARAPLSMLLHTLHNCPPFFLLRCKCNSVPSVSLFLVASQLKKLTFQCFRFPRQFAARCEKRTNFVLGARLLATMRWSIAFRMHPTQLRNSFGVVFGEMVEIGRYLEGTLRG